MLVTYNGQTQTNFMTVRLTPRNKSPYTDAGPDRSLRSTNDVLTLNGIVRDDGLPLTNTLTVAWQKRFVASLDHFHAKNASAARLISSKPYD